MSFGQSISTCFSKIGVFSGRASRSEFWYFSLFIFLLGIVVNLLASLLNLNGDAGFGVFSYIIAIIFFLVELSVGSRRLHDTGRSGWLQLLLIIPCVGIIILIIFWAQPSKPGDNAHGPAPA